MAEGPSPRPLAKAWGRVRQVGYFLWARPEAHDEAWALACLPDALKSAFLAMGPQDRAHALRVARRLEAQGAPGALLEVALLHDVAKPAEVGLVGRVAHVALAPLFGHWPGLRSEALARFAQHEAESLRLAREGGASPQAIAHLAHLNGEGPDPDPVWTEAFLAADEAG